MPSFSRSTTGSEVVAAFADHVKGKTVVITGTSEGGLGAESAIALAEGHPKQLILLARTEAKVTPVIEKIKNISPSTEAIFLKIDLADNSSVRETAANVNKKVEKVDILINCAGIMAVKDFQMSADGIEMHFASNHVGHFLLTNLLMEKLIAAGKGARVVNVTSTGYGLCGPRFEDWNFQDGKVYNPWLGYGASKSANVLFSQSLADKLKASGGQSYSVHPGLILESQLQSNAKVTPELFQQGWDLGKQIFGDNTPPMEAPKSLPQGTASILMAALDPSIEESTGGFVMDCTLTDIIPHSKGEDNKQKLWELSNKLAGEGFASGT